MREFGQGLRAIEFWLVLTACGAGLLGVRWWIAVPLSTAGLMLCVWPTYAALLPRVWRAGAEREFVKMLALSGLNSVGAASAAFLVGAAIRFLWF